MLGLSKNEKLEKTFKSIVLGFGDIEDPWGKILNLLQKGAVPRSADDLFIQAAKANELIVIQLMAERKLIEIDNFVRSNPTVLHAVSALGRSGVVKFLIENGADVNAKNSCGATALYKAAEGGHIDTLRVLIDARAELDHCAEQNLEEIYWGCYAFQGDLGTPLAVAAREGHVKCVEELLKHGARGDIVFTRFLEVGAPPPESSRNLSAYDVAKTDEIRDLLRDVCPKKSDIPKQPQPLTEPLAQKAVQQPSEQVVIETKIAGGATLSETFDFTNRIKTSVVIDAEGRVKDPLRKAFDQLDPATDLRLAFERYKMQGGQLDESVIEPRTKPVTSVIINIRQRQ